VAKITSKRSRGEPDIYNSRAQQLARTRDEIQESRELLVEVFEVEPLSAAASALIKLTRKVTRKVAANLTHHFVTLIASLAASFMVRQDYRCRNASKALLPRP
jgi:hypothetical protein